MRLPALLLVALAGCAERDRRPAAPAAAPPPRVEPAKPPSRWQPVPAKADGTVVPGGRRHIVKAGETGLAIAAAYKVPWRTIAAANSIGFDSVIRVGQPLFIPTLTTGPAPARPDPEALARAFSLDIDDLVSGSAVAAPPAVAATRTPDNRPAGQQAQPGAQQGASQSLPQRMPPGGVPAVPPLAWPTDGRVILSGFGPKPGGLVNEGVVIKTLAGSPVRAAAPGTVLYVGDAIPSFGLLMLVRHEGGAITAYGHLADALAAKGARVEQGAIIARAGQSGAAKEPQLLFQLRLGRKAVDPLLYLRRPA